MATSSFKKIYRSRRDRMIAGICGGLGIYFQTDSTWFRLLFLVLLILFGFPLFVYLIMWLIVPKEPLDRM